MTAAAETLAERRTRGGVWAFVRRHLLTAYAVLAFVYLLVPVAVVVAFSFNAPKGRFNFTWQGFTLDDWVNWDAVPGLRDALKLSLEIAALSSIFATALGIVSPCRTSRPSPAPREKAAHFAARLT